ncbi:UNKNOWN [Stylonychia lemnae]|uniref:Uncharacterized protein n=1 Tax=Stylonychia lemnae TaxID=5949 RepID=A0A078A734_STYLE|nr:UNKNOWN [Stylonychia lemnae]|eukprot:CDW77691.1 UNKNOWN [Stylonychia lemnae]
MSYHISDPLIRAENDQKDLIIAQLKAEAFELRQKDRDFRSLHEQYLNIQHKRRKGDDYSVDHQGLLRMSDDKLERIEAMRADIQRKTDLNHALKLDISDQEREALKLSDEVKQQLSQNDVVRSQNISKQKKIEIQEKDNWHFQSELERLVARNQDHLQEIDGKRVQENRQEQELREKQQQLQDIKDRINQYEKSINDNERRLLNENQRQEEISQRIRQQRILVDESDEKLRRAQLKRKEIQAEIERADRENSDLRRAKARSEDETKDLQTQIEALNRHIELLGRQNDELAQELQIMVETDELIRERLNRRERVQQIRGKNEEQLYRSQAHLERSKSPTNKYRQF